MENLKTWDKGQYETIGEYLHRKEVERLEGIKDTRLFWMLLGAIGLFFIYWAV